MATLAVTKILIPYIKNELITTIKKEANGMLISMFSMILTNVVIGNTEIITTFNNIFENGKCEDLFKNKTKSDNKYNIYGGFFTKKNKLNTDDETDNTDDETDNTDDKTDNTDDETDNTDNDKHNNNTDDNNANQKFLYNLLVIIFSDKFKNSIKPNILVNKNPKDKLILYEVLKLIFGDDVIGTSILDNYVINKKVINKRITGNNTLAIVTKAKNIVNTTIKRIKLIFYNFATIVDNIKIIININTIKNNNYDEVITTFIENYYGILCFIKILPEYKILKMFLDVFNPQDKDNNDGKNIVEKIEKNIDKIYNDIIEKKIKELGLGNPSNLFSNPITGFLKKIKLKKNLYLIFKYRQRYNNYKYLEKELSVDVIKENIELINNDKPVLDIVKESLFLKKDKDIEYLNKKIKQLEKNGEEITCERCKELQKETKAKINEIIKNFIKLIIIETANLLSKLTSNKYILYNDNNLYNDDELIYYKKYIKYKSKYLKLKYNNL